MSKLKKQIKFYRTNEKFGCFSNFSQHPIFLDGQHWKTSEHYFQAQKFEHPKDQLAVQKAKTAMQAARIGRDRYRKLKSDWEEIKDDLMRKAVRAKVMQHPQVKETLLSTNDAMIIEHTKNDNYWADGGDGSGKNMLGKILMEIRDELTKKH
jgi:ribA/ribD-fused uncharacterized protein